MQLFTPEVAALHWAVFATPLVQGIALSNGKYAEDPAFALTRERKQWLQQLDANPEPLLRHLQSRCNSPRLGLVFESLWHFFLEQDPHTELIVHNLPIRNATQTLGELDLLYRNLDNGQLLHLELAVKYYLHHPAGAVNGRAASCWYGPELRDRLDLKLERLRTHQLPLSDDPVAVNAIAELAPAETIHQQLRMQGVLFGRSDTDFDTDPVDELHRGLTRGRLLTLTEVNATLREYDDVQRLAKPQWLTLTRTLDRKKHAVPTDPDQLGRLCARQPQLLVARRDGVQRLLMVTADDWGQKSPD